jgi:hypothetical protein
MHQPGRNAKKIAGQTGIDMTADAATNAANDAAKRKNAKTSRSK